MTEYDNTNRGALFKNNRKAADTHADYTGTLNINGVDHWISAWVKDGKQGKFFSLSIKPKDGTSTRPESPEKFKAEAKRVFPDATLDDDLPF
jgi:hypothetical protein